MSDLFGGLIKPGDGARRSLQRELELRRDQWSARKGDLYRGAGDYLLRHGKFYVGRELPEEYRDAPTTGNACFDNAYWMARSHPELRYVEGVYSTGANHFTPHAWCIDADDLMVEITYPTYDLENHTNEWGMPILPPERFAYWGVIFTADLVEWHVQNVGELCMFPRPAADAHSTGAKRWGPDFYEQDHDFPILRMPYDPTMVSL